MRAVLALAAATLLAGLAPAPARSGTSAAAVDSARLVAADADPDDWLSHGRTYAEQRYSPLDQIRAENVAQLGLAWWLDTDTTRGLEATPLVADGVLYTTGSWGAVYAVDARTGKLLWKHDPAVPRQTGQKACCDVVNRGVAQCPCGGHAGTGRLHTAR